MKRRPWRPYSRYRDNWNVSDGALALATDFDADGFTWASKSTTTRDEVFWRQASSGKLAPAKRQPEPEWYELVRDWQPDERDERCFGGALALVKAAPERGLALYTPPVVIADVIELTAWTPYTRQQWEASAKTPDDYERYLEGVRMRSTKAAVLAA